MHKRRFLIFFLFFIYGWGALTQYLAFADFYIVPYNEKIFFLMLLFASFLCFLIFIIIQFVNINFIFKNKWVWLGHSLFLSILTLFIDSHSRGRYNNIIIENITFDIGYFILLFYIFFLASRRSQSNKSNEYYLNYPVLLEIFLTIVILYFIYSFMDKYLFFVFGAVIIGYLFISGYKKSALLVSLAMILSFGFLMFTNNYLINRISDYYIHQGNYHQVEQCINSFHYGGIFGIGLERTQRTYENGNLLPEALSDSAFAVLVEHFGILGGIILIALLTYLIYVGFKLYIKNKGMKEGVLLTLLLLVFFLLNLFHILNCINFFPFGSELSFFSLDRGFTLFSFIYLGFLFKQLKSE